MQSHILSILIVDDEKSIREDLKLFDWEANGTVLVGEARNGQEALNFCREYVPDVVITDITMPKMDGIQLSKLLKKEFPQIQIILLTAYTDFQYAKEAIKLGALDYLVKVLWDEEQLVNVLNKARNMIIREKLHQKNSLEQLRFQASELINIFLKADTLGSNHIESHLQLMGITLSYPFRFTKLFINVAVEDILFVDRALQKLLGELEISKNRSFTWIPLKPGEYYLLFKKTYNDIDLLKKHLEEVLAFLQEGLSKNISYISSEISLFAFISHSVSCNNQMLNRMKEINCCNHYGFYDNLSKVSFIDDFSFTTLTPNMIKEQESKLRNCIHDRDILIGFLQHEFYYWCTQYMIHPDELKGLITKWRGEWLEYLSGNQIIEMNYEILDSTTLSMMIQGLIKELKSNDAFVIKHRYEIRTTVEMIEQNISKQLTLSSVSEEVGLSPNYLSQLFRDEIGKSFNEYITELRIKKAIQLLQNTNLKVYEIAEEIGIPSYRYFSVLFRKWTGLTPKEYRKR